MPDDASKTLRELKEERAFRLTHEKYRYYEPNAKCEEYIRMVGSGENFIVLFSAANGVGKTCVSANVVAHILFGNDSENPWFDHPLYKKWPYPKQGRIVSEHTNLTSNLIPTLKEWLPTGRYTSRKAGKSYDSAFETDNGWSFDVMTYDQEVKEFESTTLGWIWFDEPPPEAIFKACVGRLRKGGIIFISETPLSAAWLYDHVIANPTGDLLDKGQRVYIEAGVEAACKQHGTRGHLEHANIEKMTAEYSEDEKQARVHGKFQHLVGLRFKDFNRKVHVIKPFHVNKQDFTVYESLDVHPRHPDAATWIAVDRQNNWYVVDELKYSGETEGLATEVKAKADRFRIQRRVIDPSAFNEDQHNPNGPGGKSLALKLSGLGVSYMAATKARTDSDKCIEDALSYRRAPGTEEILKPPQLFVFETCVNTIFELEHYSWDNWVGKSVEKHGLKEKTVDKDDHYIETIGRTLFMGPTWIEPPPPQRETYGEEYNPDPYATT